MNQTPLKLHIMSDDVDFCTIVNTNSFAERIVRPQVFKLAIDAVRRTRMWEYAAIGADSVAEALDNETSYYRER